MRIWSFIALGTALFVSLHLTGCAPAPVPPPPKPKPAVNYYHQGYDDGCWTKRHPGVRKNQYLYNKYHSYRNGWNKGYNTCKPMMKPKPKPAVNYYNKGYDDGCWTKRHPGVRKNQLLYNKYSSYRNGWHKGYNSCKPVVKPLTPLPKPKPLPKI